ncbi:MAG TPA: Mur ligase family protein [Candidatus Paceibacterota bacterium]
MKDKRKFFKDKKITQMGLGLLGRGVGDAAFLAKHGADLLVTDIKNEKDLISSFKKLKKYRGIKFVLGEHRLEDFRNRDFILKAAGVPLDSPYIAEGKKNKIPIEMDASLFFKLMPKGVTFIGVTGTRGKTTTVYLIYEILKRFLEVRPQTKRGLTSLRPKVFLAGNIKDTATLPLLEKVRLGDFVVLELDSWQLQGFGDAKISPHIAVFTTFLDDHLIYYKGDRKQYFTDKANIFKYQKKGGVLVMGDDVVKVAHHLGAELPSGARIAKAIDLPKNWKLKILGEHNRANVACALATARALKIPDEISRKVFKNFGGVPGRLEFLREIRGVKIYNDTCATTPDATVAALQALSSKCQVPSSKQIPNYKFQKEKKIVLILGGSDKGLDMTNLVAQIPKYCKSILLLPGSGSEKLKVESLKVKNLKEAVKKAVAVAKKGDIILFSPAFASFGLFKNEYDRGEQFVKLVKEL